jgi:hypothetical protein
MVAPGSLKKRIAIRETHVGEMRGNGQVELSRRRRIADGHAHGRRRAMRSRACHEGGCGSRANALRRVLNPTTLNRMHEE